MIQQTVRLQNKMISNKINSLIPVLLILFLIWGIAEAKAAPPKSVNTVAKEIDTAYNQSQIEKNETLSTIQQERETLNAQLERLKTTLARAQQKLDDDTALLKALSEKRDSLKKEIATRLLQKEALDTIITGNARNFLGRAEKSPFSAKNPERLTRPADITDKGDGVGMADIVSLLALSFQDMEASGSRSVYTGSVLDRSGREIESHIVRLGHMAALYRTAADNGASEDSQSTDASKGALGFLTLSPASGRLLMSADPPYFVRRDLTAFMTGESLEVPIDISGGIAIRQLSKRTTLMDQLRSGGILVIPILLVGLIALFLTIERLIFLGRVRQNTDALMTRVTDLVMGGDFSGALKATTPHQKRPTGRVLMAGLKHRGESRGVIESALSQAILRETPRLERFLGALKVSAAVAPLLGLLGTVTGMINTFQVITTHGTGDPRLMAGGISEAMVTTQVGLAVAIPIMIVAAWLGRRAHTLSQDMEEKGLALMAALLTASNGNGLAHLPNSFSSPMTDGKPAQKSANKRPVEKAADQGVPKKNVDKRSTEKKTERAQWS